MIGDDGPAFILFSAAHLAAIGLFCCAVSALVIFKKRWPTHPKTIKTIERLFAVSLLMMEIIYHLWLVSIGQWNSSDSLPLELCSVSLIASILLLWTGNRRLMDFVFYAGIGGALQAMATPVLDLSYPHFRYFHFFYTHSGIMLTALYFIWIKGYRPTFKGVWKTMAMLNLLLPIVVVVNLLRGGNYMFLRMKPANGSLLDYLGPYPWYILSLEVVAFCMFTVLWLVFRNKRIR